MLPNQLWTVWLQGEANAPAVVQACLASWRRLQPSWEFVVLDRTTLPDFCDFNVDRYAHLDAASLSDLVRVDLLARHGGVWVDSTLLPRFPLESWLAERMTSGFFAFANPGRDRLLANWFLAAAPLNPLVVHLRSSLLRYFDFPFVAGSRKRVLRSLMGWILPHSRALPQLCVTDAARRLLRVHPYFAFHYLFARDLATNDASSAIWDKTPRVLADMPHLAQHLGLDRALTPVVQHSIDASPAPLFKLDWRYSIAPQPHGAHTVLSYLLASASTQTT